ncbi:MAG TPA: bifunctional (p)ppGpp synthetase/guanosine-3',5'-bis(diphosphate) 3'-pyrophosphohydrolase [Pseudomonadota bacterium]|nr:bifunctional (p)ppGpp synthetase/guanosine-3',5'-bis(diphosphate) 3'-pyrophosphohydrolase [Xanthomonadales bacterium]MBP7419587.1 bifunctional (p)ppGpp synthetase/guanosine-3',5'-bis(diphosphate) 3'-pyrophosphohydrolase [Xanthomonadales bacterium]HQX26131.1 bifunctional (p)ppGpp synthetase/guanosine-3',5'-bis(diphosphate) 3'-pyrophosphohydrolase [Pseudomonadota bacterium]HQY37703.1 bifunctional (p)ppGpp synthetase/guanosine-3',5'-bis(diphosphate) 3'-pyrophosphohydrolase [Pseudomonadota bacter
MNAAGATLVPAAEQLPSWLLALEDKLGTYLAPEVVARVREAYRLGARAHEGQTRKSGEPYITHPVAVAGILADLRLDAEAVIAAILHDTIEDTPVKRADIAGAFGEEVAELVDGVTKLDRVQFRSTQEANAESFRKMLLAMARDLRVILIKLADRLHNMRTLQSMAAESRRRIARETLEIYAPIAQRLGMNRFKAELQDLAFRALHPMRYRVLEQRLRQTYGTRRDSVARVEVQVAARLEQAGIPARLVSRVKSPYSIYSKMRSEHKSLTQVLDVYGVRVVVHDVMQCYVALGIAHSLYKPLDARFKDFIAIPKANGYQSLHTMLFGPNGTPIEVQIRTEEMDLLAEKGVAAHWAYKTEALPANAAQARAREWLTNLVSAQSSADSALEFVENVKVDLFPDEVYLFTPKGDILALPRNATALDFAYAVHTDVGDHAVAARVDRKLVPLRSRLQSGQSVEVITAPSASPSPNWLEYVVSAKARTAIRHFLKRLQHEDAIELGHRMLDNALDELQSSLDSIAPEALDAYLAEHRLRRLEDLLADIALGNRMPAQVAQQLASGRAMLDLDHVPRSGEKILITGAERGVLTFGACCHPIPGDEIMGFLSAGKGVVVHRADCHNVAEFRKTPDRCVAIAWDRNVQGEFKTLLKVVVDNRPGVLATIAAAIAEAGSNIENVEYQERDGSSATLQFTLEVRDRKHLAQVMRRVRRAGVVHAVHRATT